MRFHNDIILLSCLGAMLGRVVAVHTFPAATQCPVVGQPCSYTYQQSGSTITVNGFCAPNRYCADNGAACTSDVNCYNYCGTGTCGGVRATCDSTDAFQHGSFMTTCDTDRGVTCNLADRVCEIAPSQPSRRSNIKRRSGALRYGSLKQYKYKRPEQTGSSGEKANNDRENLEGKSRADRWKAAQPVVVDDATSASDLTHGNATKSAILGSTPVEVPESSSDSTSSTPTDPAVSGIPVTESEVGDIAMPDDSPVAPNTDTVETVTLDEAGSTTPFSEPLSAPIKAEDGLVSDSSKDEPIDDVLFDSTLFADDIDLSDQVTPALNIMEEVLEISDVAIDIVADILHV